jgi:hypothetical protein
VTAAHPYPYLAHLLGAYFHQDALDDGRTDEDIFRDFVETSQAHDILGARADILRLLHDHPSDEGILRRLHGLFKLELSIGSTDLEAADWLRRAEQLFRK